MQPFPSTFISSSSGTPDPYWANCVLALRCDGSNGSTTFTDLSNSAQTVTANGSAAISTAQTKFYTSSLNIPDRTSYLSISTINLDNTDFTIRFWMYGNTGGYNNMQFPSNGFAINADATNIYIYTGSTTLTFTGASNTAGQWNFIEIARSGTTIYAFSNGTSLGSQGGSATATNGSIKWGTNSDGNTGAIVYYQDIQIYSGVVLHTASFTPPTQQFSNF